MSGYSDRNEYKLHSVKIHLQRRGCYELNGYNWRANHHLL